MLIGLQRYCLLNKKLQKQISQSSELLSDIVTQIKDGYDSDGISITIKDESVLSDTSSQQKNGIDIDASTVEAETNETQLDVMVSACNMLELYIIGIVIIIFSVGVSSFAVMRLKPREILSKMS